MIGLLVRIEVGVDMYCTYVMEYSIGWAVGNKVLVCIYAKIK